MFFGETLMCLSLWIFTPPVVAAEDRVHAGPRWRGQFNEAGGCCFFNQRCHNTYWAVVIQATRVISKDPKRRRRIKTEERSGSWAEKGVATCKLAAEGFDLGHSLGPVVVGGYFLAFSLGNHRGREVSSRGAPHDISWVRISR
jgi:hypothetical protein